MRAAIPSEVVARAQARLASAADEFASVSSDITPEEWLLLRARVGRLLARFNDDLGTLDAALGMASAQRRILSYLLSRRGEVVTESEISGVAGISAWARRVRELREDHGWLIHTTHTMPQLGPGEYLLARSEPDPSLVGAWLAARDSAKLRTRGGLLPPKARPAYTLRLTLPTDDSFDITSPTPAGITTCKRPQRSAITGGRPSNQHHERARTSLS